LTAVLTPAHRWLAPRRSHGLDTKDRAGIDDVVIVKIIVPCRRDLTHQSAWDKQPLAGQRSPSRPRSPAYPFRQELISRHQMRSKGDRSAGRIPAERGCRMRNGHRHSHPVAQAALEGGLRDRRASPGEALYSILAQLPDSPPSPNQAENPLTAAMNLRRA